MASFKEDVTEMMKEEGEDFDDDDAEENSGEEDEESLQKAKQAITCRSVTLNTLMEDGIISHGQGVLSIDYLGQRFEADLLETGKIKWHGSQEEFGTPSAWALHCKRLVNPIKRSGCGWASVKYKNRKLDIWKSMWARKHRTNNPFKSPHQTSNSTSTTTTSQSTPPAVTTSATTCPRPTNSCSNSPAASTTPTTTPSADNPESIPPSLKPAPSCLTEDNPKTRLDSGDYDDLKEGQSEQLTGAQLDTLVSPTAASVPVSRTSNGSRVGGTPFSNEGTPLNLSPLSVSRRQGTSPISHSPRHGKLRLDEGCMKKERISLSYSSLGARKLDMDLLTLVKCEHFDQHSKIQPFTVSVTSNTLLLMDFHCHLTKSEVVGYLAGRWNSHTQHLSIEQAFPVCCRLGDKDRAPHVEDEIRSHMRHKNMMVVGWYHSHPQSQPDPSIRDVDCQMSYQLKMRCSASMYLPCLGFIISPFEKLPPKPDSKIQAFWVMPNLEHPASYNIPMHVTYSIVRDLSLTEDLLADMKQLTEFYRAALDKVNMKEHWGEAITYKDKIKASLRSKLPEDQLDSGTFLDYVQQLLHDMR